MKPFVWQGYRCVKGHSRNDQRLGFWLGPESDQYGTRKIASESLHKYNTTARTDPLYQLKILHIFHHEGLGG